MAPPPCFAWSPSPSASPTGRTECRFSLEEEVARGQAVRRIVGDRYRDLEIGDAVAIDVSRHRPDPAAIVDRDQLSGMAVAGEAGGAVHEGEGLVARLNRVRVDPREIDDVAEREVEDVVGRGRGRFGHGLVAEDVAAAA